MEYENSYLLINKVHSKLMSCTQRRKKQKKDFDLRVLVGHANLLDRLMDEYESSGSYDSDSDEDEYLVSAESEYIYYAPESANNQMITDNQHVPKRCCQEEEIQHLTPMVSRSEQH
ncbi:hypothetical protein Kpol_1028p90 [Vanderwaltozyma polyspora DSM 70294]|uniref:Uncharacterized protein n=1 Tax=Vanderwaltozyma polyspora (strain ATCC 22028 / DSM 70294 / BCRC 21397 / CBS 2163 / NBRC 10782 / NRRL Y-8283 / UCD 57-17) TaxID=436907 RepID=A7TG57_VANPO|nr:uncharacterized protein Kpol_1028p90 [Vanderwaltozyma polyspora DSM 70294]EDO18814.1 hypothetical protein Kpol_1028p90 [Vanderwaltozyma polyspora DSM 70294]